MFFRFLRLIGITDKISSTDKIYVSTVTTERIVPEFYGKIHNT